MSLAGYEAVPRYAEMIHRIFGEDVDFVPPGLILELDRPEWKLYKREMAWTTGQVSIAASPANLSRVQVLNRLNSGRIAVVTHVSVNTLGASPILLTISAAAAATPAPCLNVDTRPPFAAGPGAPTVGTQSLIANNNAVVSGYRYAEFLNPAGGRTLFTLPYPVILDEGQNFTVFDTTVNEALTCFIYGYERPARSEELND